LDLRKKEFAEFSIIEQYHEKSDKVLLLLKDFLLLNTLHQKTLRIKKCAKFAKIKVGLLPSLLTIKTLSALSENLGALVFISALNDFYRKAR